MGWHLADGRTRLLIKDGKPSKIETTARDLDQALDAAAQFYGEPLERTGPWLNDAGDEPSGELGDDPHERCTCTVATAAQVHALVYRIDDECDTTLAELIAANADAPLDPHEIAAIQALGVGDTLTLGGGAWATRTLRRVS